MNDFYSGKNPIIPFHPPSLIRLLAPVLSAVLLCVITLVFASAASAQTSLEDARQAQAEASQNLADIQASIALSAQRREEMRQEIESMDGDRTRQNAALIAAAQRVKLTEIEVADAEQRLQDLLAQENEIRLRLEGSNINISNLLAALQRISKNPPPALIINPSDAVDSARAASLLSSVLPQLREKADVIIADLNQLNSVKQSVLEEKDQLSARFATLFEEQLRIATLIEARKRGAVRLGVNIEEEEAQAEALAREASSLQELITSLQTRIESIAEASQAADQSDASQQDTAPVLSDEAVALALADTQRTTPAFPFTSAMGHLQIPATGVVVTEFGADDGFGGISSGVSVVTRADAQVVAPADGWVMYKGPYLHYGQIIILNPGNDHTILLAGLGNVSVELGQFVLLGEPVGTMGTHTLGQTLTTSAGVSRPTLYIEFRDKNTPIDPAPWWTKPTISNQSQTQTG